MAKQKDPPAKGTKVSGFVVGRARFTKISAVEGIHLTQTMEKRASEASRKARRLRNVAARSCAAIARAKRAACTMRLTTRTPEGQFDLGHEDFQTVQQSTSQNIEQKRALTLIAPFPEHG